MTDPADVRRDLWWGDDFVNRTAAYQEDKFDEIQALGWDFERDLDIEYWQTQTRDAWLEFNPQSPTEVFRFYQECDSYIPELMLWNTRQVQQITQYHRWLADRGVTRVLDYGAGVGDVVLSLALTGGYEAWYADVDGPGLSFFNDRCEARGVQPPTISIRDPSFDLRELDREWDAIICADVLEHLPDPTRILSSFRDSLSDDGVLITQWTFDDKRDDPDSVDVPLHIQDGRSTSSRVLDHLRQDFVEVDRIWPPVVRLWEWR